MAKSHTDGKSHLLQPLSADYSTILRLLAFILHSRHVAENRKSKGVKTNLNYANHQPVALVLPM